VSLERGETFIEGLLITCMDTNQSNLEYAVTTITLKKALEFCKKYFGRIQWEFIRELGFGDIPQEQIIAIYSKVTNLDRR